MIKNENLLKDVELCFFFMQLNLCKFHLVVIGKMKAKGRFISHRFSFRIYSICTRCFYFSFFLWCEGFQGICLTIFCFDVQGVRKLKYSWFGVLWCLLYWQSRYNKWPLVYEGMNFNIHVHFSCGTLISFYFSLWHSKRKSWHVFILLNNIFIKTISQIGNSVEF